MSLDFIRYPHLVSEIEVYSATGLPDGVDHETGWETYFRYRHPRAEDYLIDGAIYLAGYTETGNRFAPIDRKIFMWSKHENLTAICGLGELAVNGDYDYDAGSVESRQNVRKAVAGLFGYEPGLEYLDWPTQDIVLEQNPLQTEAEVVE